MDPEAAGDEFQALFVGVGKSAVSLYASHYLGPQSGRPLAEIRAALAGIGLARRPGSSEFEDHLSVVLETMRMLVAGEPDGARRRSPARDSSNGTGDWASVLRRTSNCPLPLLPAGRIIHRCFHGART
jgi:TorA maturation chaperone TorD